MNIEVFEQSFMTLQIETNRGIAAQILRHRSFTFGIFMTYADSTQLGNIPLPELRRQDFKIGKILSLTFLMN